MTPDATAPTSERLDANRVHRTINCARALIAAHLATARAHGAWGASRGFLSSYRNAGKLNSKDWEEFERLCSERLQGLRLERKETAIPGGVAIRLVTERQKEPTRPSVLSLTNRLYEGTLPAPVIADLYRANLRAEYPGLRDVPRFHEWISQRLQRLLYASGKRSLEQSVNELLPTERFSPEDVLRSNELALVEVLEGLGVLAPAPEDPGLFSVESRVDSGRVLMAIFGRSTGVAGLDRLLNGAAYYPMPSEEAEADGVGRLTMSVTGSPGMGKSTLAAAVSAAAAARGALVVYLEFEQTQADIHRQFTRFCPDYLRSHCFRFAAYSGSEVPAPKEGEPEGGTILISDLSSTPMSDWRKIIHLLRDLKHDQYREKLVIFDSISVILSRIPLRQRREFLSDLSQTLRESGYSVFLVIGTDAANAHPVEEFVVDLSIALGGQPQSNPAYSIRSLEIVKSRWQASNRGAHRYVIEAGRGLVVSPSSVAVLTMRRRSEAPTAPGERRPMRLPFPGFARYLADAGPDADDSEPIPWITPGSVTLLVGDPGAKKSLVTREFLNAAATDPGDRRATLTVRFGAELLTEHTDPQDVKERNLRPSNVGILYEVHAGPGQPLEFQQLFRSSFVSPGQVLEEMERRLADCDRTQTRLSRAVISGIANIGSSFPFLREDPLFLPALCGLLSGHEVALILVFATPDEHRQDPLLDQALGLSQNVIRFHYVKGLLSHPIALRIEKCASSAHHRGYFELYPGPPKPEIRPSFELVRHVGSADPSPAVVHLVLHQGTGLREKYNQGLKDLFEETPQFRVTLDGESSPFRRRMIPRHFKQLDNSLWITMARAYEIGAATAPVWPKGTDLRLAPLPIPTGEARQLWKLLSFAGAFGPDAETPPAQLRAIPYFLNPSFLTLRDDFAKDLGSENPATQTWAGLIAAAQDFRKRAPEVQLFDLTMESQESLTCFFMEILAQICGGTELLSKLFLQLKGDPKFSAGEERALREAMRIARDLMEEALSFRRKQDPNDSSARVMGNAAALIRREWYNTYRNVEAELGLLEQARLQILPLPGNVSTNGDWYLGVVEGSAGVRQGLDLIKEHFVNFSNAMSVMHHGVGLSPFRLFYEKGGLLPVLGVPPKWFQPYVEGKNVIYRSQLNDYSRQGRVFGTHIKRAIEAEGADAMDAVRHVFDLVRKH